MKFALETALDTILITYHGHVLQQMLDIVSNQVINLKHRTVLQTLCEIHTQSENNFAIFLMDFLQIMTCVQDQQYP